jgi:hypothetical protein
MNEDEMIDPTKGNVFDQIFSKSKEVLDKLIEAAKRPALRRAKERQFEESIDAQENAIIDLESELFDLRHNVVNYTVKAAMEIRDKIEGHKARIALIKDERFVMLGTPVSK